MKNLTKHPILFLILPLAILFISQTARGQNKESLPQNVEELKAAILEILQETATPAAGIAIVNHDGTIWVDGLGKADREKDIDADAETMFRIGSTSKIFIGLAVLKLQEQGKLNLKDRVSDLIPEIEFKNPWEETNPILVEHLLEHTTGWDDLHLPEIFSDGSILPLKETLELHPHSRKSRWVPGSRMAYSNIGPNVAAYVVEKISGQPFEEFLREQFFDPMGMETITFFQSEKYLEKGATLYKEGVPSAYGHMLMRASGSINASPRDMAKLLQFFINRGKIDSAQVLSEHSLNRMETPSTTSGARAGLVFGYGLGIYTSMHEGFVYYKHGGSVGNGKSDFSYQPEYGIGYSLQINSDNSNAIRRISRLIRDYQTTKLPQPDKKNYSIYKSASHPVDGYYQLISPRKKFSISLPPMMVERVWSKGDTLYNQFPAHFGDVVKFVAVDQGKYHNLLTDRLDAVVVNDPLEGAVLELAGKESGTITLGYVPGVFVFVRLLLFLLWILLIIQASLLVPFWSYRYWKAKIADGDELLIRLVPLIPVLYFISFCGLLIAGPMIGIEFIDRPTILSVGIMMTSVGFFASALFSLLISIIYKNRGIKKSVYVPSTILSVLHTLVAFYFLWHGVIGFRSWA